MIDLPYNLALCSLLLILSFSCLLIIGINANCPFDPHQTSLTPPYGTKREEC